MCGIFFSCGLDSPSPPSEAVLEQLRRRGPDHLDTVSQCVDLGARINNKKYFHLTATSSVLSLRRDKLVPQPMRNISNSLSSFFLWNGEAWKFDGMPIETHDGELIYSQLCMAITACPRDTQSTFFSPDSAIQAVLTILAKISGPYAFVFYDSVNRRVFYARDALGRRSLLIRWPSPRSVEISSVRSEPAAEGWEEVEAEGVFYLDLGRIGASFSAPTAFESKKHPLKPILIPWSSTDHDILPTCRLVGKPLSFL